MIEIKEYTIYNDTPSFQEQLYIFSIKKYFRPRFIRDEINITDHLFFAIVHQNTAPKNFLRYHNLTTSQLNKKFVVFQQTETKDIG